MPTNHSCNYKTKVYVVCAGSMESGRERCPFLQKSKIMKTHLISGCAGAYLGRGCSGFLCVQGHISGGGAQGSYVCRAVFGEGMLRDLMCAGAYLGRGCSGFLYVQGCIWEGGSQGA